tara:strand:+ start:1355 stop:1684 length:330 start_codon:yes stop_codon:yes gene_type:complete
MKKYFLASLLLAFPAFAEPDNSIVKACQAKHNYNGLNETKTWSDIATCIVSEKNKIIRAEEDRLWQFVLDNPHYRYPGIALPNGEKAPFDPNHFAPKRWSLKSFSKKSG